MQPALATSTSTIVVNYVSEDLASKLILVWCYYSLFNILFFACGPITLFQILYIYDTVILFLCYYSLFKILFLLVVLLHYSKSYTFMTQLCLSFFLYILSHPLAGILDSCASLSTVYCDSRYICDSRYPHLFSQTKSRKDMVPTSFDRGVDPG